MLGSAPNRCRPQHLQKSQNKKEGLTKVKPSFFNAEQVYYSAQFPFIKMGTILPSSQRPSIIMSAEPIIKST